MLVMSTRVSTFFVGSIPIYGDLILAPMRGYSDLPYRSICRIMGSSMSYTSFIGAIEILSKDKETLRILQYLPEERPVAFQIYDSDERRLLKAARQIQMHNPDVIDINMGCSIRGIAGRGAGAGLLQDRIKVGKIMKRLTTQLRLPISAKIRLGWSHHDRNYLDIARTIEDQGGDLIAVHARTRDQGFQGNADWDAIAEIKEAVNIPVIGNGDVKSIEDIDRIKKHTGCDAVMIGRAAKGNPWIFQHRSREEVTLEEVASIIHLHLDRMITFYGHRLGMLRFRKHLSAYLKPMRIPKSIRIAMLTCHRRTHLKALLQEIGLERPTDPPHYISSFKYNHHIDR
jgi:tRNA-dihydrouridine synthase B